MYDEIHKIKQSGWSTCFMTRRFCERFFNCFSIKSFAYDNLNLHSYRQVSSNRFKRHEFWPRLSLFFLRRKGEWSSKNCDEKSCLLDRSFCPSFTKDPTNLRFFLGWSNSFQCYDCFHKIPLCKVKF